MMLVPVGGKPAITSFCETFVNQHRSPRWQAGPKTATIESFPKRFPKPTGTLGNAPSLMRVYIIKSKSY
ncbi:MAG: hypothetical protein JNJ60_13520 [Rhodocyclaceae bacterium]|nr:hypothetical protein [Rhodocyclaceae bacterium]